jgi:hypothetical protein
MKISSPNVAAYYHPRTERIEADVREFKGNFKVAGERFTVEQIKGWMYEIVGGRKGLLDSRGCYQAQSNLVPFGVWCLLPKTPFFADTRHAYSTDTKRWNYYTA